MAANYWTSTQKQNWLFDAAEIDDLRLEIESQHRKLIDQYPLPDRRLLYIFIRDRIIQLSKRNMPFRQQCVATAIVYLQRYFLFNAMQNVNLYLMIATAFYLASKTEESPHHIRLVCSEARSLWQEYIPSDPSRLGEMEFCLISEMHSQLIVWHPYRSLTALKEMSKLQLTNEELSLAWSIINDSFMTDLPLTCPPFLIAVTAMFLAVVFVPGKPAMDFRDFRGGGMDAHAAIENGRYASLGGRPGISTSIGQALEGAGLGRAANGQSQTNGATVAKAPGAMNNPEKMQNIVHFLVESDIDIRKMIDATQEIISLYEVWEGYNEKTIKEAVARSILKQHLEN